MLWNISTTRYKKKTNKSKTRQIGFFFFWKCKIGRRWEIQRWKLEVLCGGLLGRSQEEHGGWGLKGVKITKFREEAEKIKVSETGKKMCRSACASKGASESGRNWNDVIYGTGSAGVRGNGPLNYSYHWLWNMSDKTRLWSREWFGCSKWEISRLWCIMCADQGDTKKRETVELFKTKKLPGLKS